MCCQGTNIEEELSGVPWIVLLSIWRRILTLIPGMW
jgi:hypothetical protein